MALTERLAILIDASSRGAVREFNNLSGAAARTDKSLTKGAVAASAFKGAVGAIGLTAVAGGMLNFAKASIQAASALEEAEQKANVVFGDSFPKVSKFARETADSFNLSERAALDFAGAFAPIFKNAGFGADAVADLSVALTAFTADFASFNNLGIEEAFTKIQSGLAGETEAVRRYGIDVSAAAVQSEAYAMGIAEVGDKLNETQKIQARASLIMKDGADAMGDVARTSDSYANVQRDLAENTEDLSAAFGKFLTPQVAESVGNLAMLLEVMNKVAPSTGDAADGTRDFGDTVKTSLNPLSNMWNRVQDLTGSLGLVNDRFGDSKEAAAGTAEGLYDAAEGALAAGVANEDLAVSAEAAAKAAEEEQEAIDELADAIEGLGSKFRDADQAQDDLTGAIEDAREPFRELKEAQDELAAATDDASRESAQQRVDAAKAAIAIKGNSEAARDNRDRLRDLARQTLETAGAYVQLDGDTERAAAETRRGREAFIKVAQQLGMTRDQARRYADQLGLVPKDVPTRVSVNGITAAQAAAVGYKGSLDRIPRYIETVIRQRRIEASIGGSLAGDQSGLRAAGGPVSAGRTYMVGEQGPELLRLRGSNGVITPASRTPDATQQPTTSVTYNITAPPEDMLRELQRAEKMRDLRSRVA